MGCQVSSRHLPGAVTDPQQKCGFSIEHTHQVRQSAIPCQVQRILPDCPTRKWNVTWLSSAGFMAPPNKVSPNEAIIPSGKQRKTLE